MKGQELAKYYVPYIEVLFHTSHFTFTGVKIIGRYTEDFVIYRGSLYRGSTVLVTFDKLSDSPSLL